MTTLRMLTGILLLAATFDSMAADDDHWSPQFGGPGADSAIATIFTQGSDVYVGGIFTTVGEAKSVGIAKWDGTHWRDLAGGMRGPTPIVYAITARGADVYVAGYFTNAGGVPARSLARWNGTSWAEVGGGVNGIAGSLQFIGDDLYVGGNFTQAGNVTATNIARWDGNNWWPLADGLTGNTNGFYPFVNSLGADSDGNLFAAGLFRFAGDLPVNNIARWDGSQWHALGSGLHSGPSPSVSDLAVRGSNVYAAGVFRSANGLNITNLARWDGQHWHAMAGGPSGTNSGLAFVGDTLYTCGNFTNISGVAARHVARWNGASWEPLAVGAAGEISTRVSCLGSGNGTLYAGGDFIRAGAAGVLGLAKWENGNWSALNGPNTKGLFLGARTIAIAEPNFYVGGTFQVAGGSFVSRIARFDGTSWNDLGGGVSGNSASVSAVIENNGVVYIGGSFTNVSGVNARNVAMWDGANWYPLASGFNNTVNALVMHQGQLFAGGAFTARGNNTGQLQGIAVWDGSDWQNVPVISEWRINNVFNALASDGNNLYVGGNFDIGWSTAPPPPIFGDGLSNIGYWDGANWRSMKPALGITVNALAFYNGHLYAGGSFTTNSAGTSLKRIARWDGNSWSAVGSGFDSGTVSALAVSPTALYAGGSFTNSGGTPLARIAKWNGTEWLPLGSGLYRTPGTASVVGMTASGEDLYVAGNFTEAGGKPATYLARWNETISFVPLNIRLLNPLWQSGQFSFDIGGMAAGTYKVDATTNFVDWEEIYSGDAANSTNVTDAPASGLRHRAYRVRTP
jgi:trimeric autotransporter adhesin